MSIEWGFPTVCDLLKGAVILIKRPVKYAMSSKSFADDLREEVRKLENEARRVDNLAQVARNNRRSFNDCFAEWQQSADKALEEARNLLDAFDKASKTCCYGTLPDPCCRYQFSTKAEAEIKVIQELRQNCIVQFKELNDICLIDLGSGNVAVPTPAKREGKDAIQSATATASIFSTSTSNKLRDDGVLESRASMIQNIMDALANNSNNVVGVYGMGGIGKSTLLEDAERKISEEKSFDWVAKANVSENPDIKTIQGEIADALGLTEIKNKETISGRAKLLRGRLTDEEREKKKVLIILDNLWKGLDLKSVGIPCGSDNKVMGCKLLLTSRDRDVLRRDMGCDKDLPLGKLEEEEAKSLFERLVGAKVHDDEFKPLVDEALPKCFGLPFLIVHMAKVFKHASLSEWKNVLKQIKLSKNEGIGEVINERLQLSYRNLKDAEKSLLALCVAYGTSKPSLENLVRYGVGWGLFREDDNMEEVRESLKSGIRTLQASSLLLEDENAYSFKIHDLVREFVASVASRDHPLLVLKNKDKSITQLSKDKLKSCRAICFPYIDVKELPQELDCPELQIFLLFTNDRSLEVPHSLFHSMRKLMVLNLTGIRLTCSPSSPFQFLKNLRTLCLNGCLLDDIAILGELKGLEILSFADSNVRRLPKEIGQLVDLRLLDLSHCSQLKIIEPGVLRSLIKLEELYMKDSFDQWNAMEQTPTNASLIELNHMKKLNILHVGIRNPSTLPKDLNVEKLTKHEIQIGNANYWPHECKGSRALALKLDPLSDVLRKGCIQSILPKTDYLLLDELDGCQLSICALSQNGFPDLKHLKVRNSPSVHYILQSPSHTDFKTLESLLLENLINLERICTNKISSKSFGTLKVVQVIRCGKMEVLFPISVLRGLSQLEEIEVFNCKLMRWIVEADDCSKVELRNLRVLKLVFLPDIKNFVNAESAPSSSTSDNQVSTQIVFFNRQQVAFHTLKTLEIIGLHNLGFIFFPSMVKSLTQLKKLTILDCKKMEAIIMEEEGLGLETSEILAFPMLTELHLEHLKSLTCFFRRKCAQESWSQDCVRSRATTLFNQEVAFQTLETLKIIDLDNLGFIFFSSMVKSLTQLKKLTISNCKKTEAIIMEEEGLGMETSEIVAFPMLTNLCLEQLESLTRFSCGKCSREAQSQDGVKSHSATLFNREVTFSRLKTLGINGLHKVEFLFSPSMIKSLAQLRFLYIYNCKKMEAISVEEEASGLETSETLEFPMLTNMILQNLESLMCISRGKRLQEARSQDHVKSCSIARFSREVAFQRLEKLKITGLDNLEFLFSPYMVKSLTQLKELEISSCEKMEAIIMEEEGLGMETSEILAFPMLSNLWLRQLKSLTCFSRGKCAQESRSQNRVGSRATTLFNQEVAFVSLENLYVHRMDNIEMIWDDQIAADSFSKLKLLSVTECKKLVNVVPSFILGQLRSLETLTAEACDSLEVLFKLQPPNSLDGNYVASSPLKKLKLSDLAKLKRIWDKELNRQVKFQSLRLVTLQKCTRLTSLFSASIARDLIQLEELEINQCGIVELIEKEGLDGHSINVEAIEGPSHEVKVASSFPSYFQHMKILDVSRCHELSNMFTLTMATNLVELTKLRISKCEILTEVISDDGGKEEHEVAFNQLKYIELDELTRLRGFSLGGHTFKFPLLEDIIVSRCPNMNFFSKGPIRAPKLERVQVSLNEENGPTEYQYFWKGNLNMTIQNMFEEMVWFAGTKFMRLSKFPKLIRKWHSELNPITSFWQLESLVVDKCPFIDAISSSLMLVLERMTSLQVCDCEPLEEIFDLKGLEAVDCTRVLPQLQDLRLANLPKLRQLWNRDLQGMMCFNSLRRMGLYKCSNLRHAFVPSMAQCLPNLCDMEIKECEQMEGVIVDEEGQGSVVEEITFPNLDQINLECLPNLTSFLSWKNHMLECPILSKLSIAHCPRMRSLTWQSSMEIDNGTPSLFTPQVQCPGLQRMVLSHMDNLSKIWIDGPQETLTCDNLLEMEVQNCRSLENLFPHWVAISLTQLKKLRVESCMIEDIVTSGDDIPHSSTAQVLFPKLTSLVMHDMPRLKSFCPNLPTLNWPLLKDLHVTHCDKVNVLSFEAFMSNGTQRNDQQELSNQEAHSSLERDFPMLKSLSLVDKNISMIQDGKFPKDIFDKAEALTLACFHDEKAAFPPIFLPKKFQNIQSLEILCSSFEEIFSDEGLVDEEKHLVLENLTRLKLNKLHNLKRVWREDSLVSKILQSIKIFEVWDCPCLTIIFPAVTSFQNLMYLNVKNSSGLVHLVTTSAVTNLVHLQMMTIIGCEKMKEVVTNDGNEEEKVISFRKLCLLTLQNLPSLECFSSAPSCSFRFPSLCRIKVEECPKMKIFTKGTLSTAKLVHATLFRYKWNGRNWLGDDLNTTIQELSA